MEKITLKSIHNEVQKLAHIFAEGFRAIATKKDLEDLLISTAKGFEMTATKEELKEFATKADMQNGFALIMEELRPMRHDYQALKDNIAPQVANLNERVTKVERKVATL
jgi:hypothetical protein